MELDFGTFFLEIVNFLVLVWLLKRFLYRPVVEFVARRRAETEEVTAAARVERQQAEALKRQYENRLEEWARERQAARRKLHVDLEQERAKRLAEIRQALAEEREKARVAEERHQREFRETAEQSALALGARFAARLLARTSGAEATAALVTLVTEEFAALAPAQRNDLRQEGALQGHRGAVETAHPLAADARRALEASLADLFGNETPWEWQVVPELIAGIRIAFGPWVLAANVRDELKDFTRLSHE